MSSALPTSGAVLGDFTTIKLETFEREASLRSGVVRDPKSVQNPNIAISAITIAASAFIFVTIVAWFAVLQAYLDVKIANPTAGKSAQSRLFFAIFTTIISIAFLVLFYLLYTTLSKAS